jgi:hypothetical protein
MAHTACGCDPVMNLSRNQLPSTPGLQCSLMHQKIEHQGCADPAKPRQARLSHWSHINVSVAERQLWLCIPAAVGRRCRHLYHHFPPPSACIVDPPVLLPASVYMQAQHSLYKEDRHIRYPEESARQIPTAAPQGQGSSVQVRQLDAWTCLICCSIIGLIFYRMEAGLWSVQQ